MFKSNPLLFKDLLISLNGKTGRSVIIAFIIIYFVAFLLILSEMKYSFSFDELPRYGKDIFLITGISQLIVLMIIGYLKGITSISSEKEKKTFSFIKISPINNLQFIGGKFLAIFLYIILLFIISLPFLSIGLILGGVNIFDVLIYTLYSISYISFSIMFGLLISILSNKFSVILGIGVLPIIAIFTVIILFLIPGYILDSGLSGYQEIFFTAIFPLSILSNMGLSESYISLFGINIHYIIYHIFIFGTVIGLIFKILLNKYKSNYELNISHYNYLESFILFIIILLLSPLFGDNYFYSIFIFIILNSLFFLFNDSLLKKGKILEIIKFFSITFILGTIYLIILNGLALYTIILYLTISISLYAIYFFFIHLFKYISKGLINLYYFIFLILFFYIIPLISSNLLEIKYLNLNDVLIKSYHNDGLLDYKCGVTKEVGNNGKGYSYQRSLSKCNMIENTSFYKYIMLYLIFSSLLIVIGSLIKNNRK